MAAFVTLFVVVSTALAPAADPQSPPRSEDPAPPAAVSGETSEDRRILVAHESERPARTNAALNLLASDPAFLAEQVRSNDSDEVVLATLEALRIRASATSPREELVAAVLERAASDENGVAMDARETLKTLDGAARDAVRPRLLAAISGEDVSRARAAIDVFARTGDLGVVEPLLGVLERSERDGALADAAATALTELLGPRFGSDATAWRSFWKECTGKTRVRILRDQLERERTAQAADLERKDREIVRLKRELDGGDPVALIANLEHEIAGVRRFSAELLTRGFPEVDLQPVRPVVLARLGRTTEPPAVEAAFLRLLAEIDRRGGRTGDDPDRDAFVGRALASTAPEVVLAGVEVATAFSTSAVRTAALDALKRVRERSLASTARIALVEAAAPAKLNLAGAVETLRDLLRRDESGDVRVACVSVFGALKIADTAPDLSHALQKDTDWRVRRRAAGALRAVAGTAALESLIAAADDPRPGVRSEAVLAVAQVGDPAAAGALIERLGREDSPAVRSALARSLGTLGSPAAIEPLAGLLRAGVGPENGVPREEVDAVRGDARDALTMIAGDDPARWDEVAKAVGDASPDVLALARRRRLEILEKAGADAPTRSEEH
ncbi:MAG: HEAT repeat domain-containing protein, partial [Planctomycetota bacterium JB042]